MNESDVEIRVGVKRAALSTWVGECLDSFHLSVDELQMCSAAKIASVSMEHSGFVKSVCHWSAGGPQSRS